MDHYEFLRQILKICPGVRFVGMYDSEFKKITDGYQADVIAHMSRDDMQNSIRYDMKRWDTYKIFEKHLGATQFAMVKFDKAILLTFLFNEKEHLRVSLEPDSNYKEVIEIIQDLIAKNPIIQKG